MPTTALSLATLLLPQIVSVCRCADDFESKTKRVNETTTCPKEGPRLVSVNVLKTFVLKKNQKSHNSSHSRQLNVAVLRICCKLLILQLELYPSNTRNLCGICVCGNRLERYQLKFIQMNKFSVRFPNISLSNLC